MLASKSVLKHSKSTVKRHQKLYWLLIYTYINFYKITFFKFIYLVICLFRYVSFQTITLDRIEIKSSNLHTKTLIEMQFEMKCNLFLNKFTEVNYKNKGESYNFFGTLSPQGTQYRAG